jgi:hypothetical protein
MALRRTPLAGCAEPVPEAVTLPTGAEMGIVPLEHRAPDEINNKSINNVG